MKQMCLCLFLGIQVRFQFDPNYQIAVKVPLIPQVTAKNSNNISMLKRVVSCRPGVACSSIAKLF